MPKYRGHYSRKDWYQVFMDGEPLPLAPSLKIRNHSPTGFSWGYGGSGPAQLALALLLLESTQHEAEWRYQDFKREVIAALPVQEGLCWELDSEDIHRWIAAQRALDTSEGFVNGKNG